MKSLLFFFLFFNANVLEAQCDSIPALNTKILKLAKTKIGKKISRGECWDLAEWLLNAVQADWNGQLIYGSLVAPSACVYPGDFIQFEKIEIKKEENGTVIIEKMYHHTAMIYQVISKDEVILLHQNTNYSGKKLGTSKLTFSTIKKGTYMIYRPRLK